IDGALAARWLAAFTARLQSPLGAIVLNHHPARSRPAPVPPSPPGPGRTPGAALGDGDIGAVGVERHVPGDLRDGGVGLLVGPDEVRLGLPVRQLNAVVAGVSLVRAVGLALGPPQQAL